MSQDHVINEAALCKLRQDILSHIALHHEELRGAQEELFDKLRTELLGAVSGITADNKRSQQSQPVLHVSQPDPKQRSDPRNVIPPDADHGLQHHAICMHDGNAGSKLGATHESASPGEIMEPSSDDQDITQESCQLRLWTRDSKRAMGEFKDHPELYAFLQAKNWDSNFTGARTQTVDEDEDSRSPRWKKFSSAIHSSKFDMMIGLLIIANSIVMGLRLEHEGMFSADKIGIKRDDGNWPNAGAAFVVLEHIFTIVFIIEMILRVAVMGRTYFTQPFNLMDFAIVLVSVLDVYIFAMMEMDFPNVSFIRLLRVFKLVRALRIIRVLKFFENLRVLVAAVSHSMRSFIWSILLLGIVQLIASIFMTQSLQSYLQDESADPTERKQVYEFFGSWSRSIITIFEMTLSIGTWGRCGRVVVFSVNRYYSLFFLGYLTLVSFGMIRVIAAMFLKDTLASASKDDESYMSNENRNPQYVRRIWDVFNELELNGDDALTLHELHVGLQDEKICKKLASLGVKPHELPGLFTLMDDGDNEISFCEWLTGIMRLKNAGKGVDLATVLYENKKILKRLLATKSDVDKLGAKFDQLAKKIP
eukprot:gnl/MRDRNA2_/MRDRNA2_52326_c0_seq2.p1 gnl/MRDRNA2_/MRDRNA2_52326_c0~~gnl/MRDRNA2_/MRDRNA2_52326_c0_seq2.p1  ORF type:complete len:624 (-),score=98.97 gnl/MRDRNA2_/MRDRNA2_52326_c0_seq2:200-1972(-)